MKHTTYVLLILALFVSTSSILGQVIEHPRHLSFEDKGVLDIISTKKSKASISDAHFKDGLHSLKWEFKPNAELNISKDLEFESKDPTGKDTYLSTFVVWIYNEVPIHDVVKFNFMKGDKVCSSFPMNLNFTGWRSAYIAYERDMEGQPEVGMNRIQILAPKTKGTLYFDMLLTSALADHRHHTRDIHLPFVNVNNDNHWLALYRLSQVKPDFNVQSEIKDSQKVEILRIEERLKELLYTPSKLTDKTLEKLRTSYATYEIQRKDNRITGKPIFFVRASEAYERLFPESWDADMYTKQKMEYRDYFNLMFDVATAYLNAKTDVEKDELRTMFMNMYDHAADQGVAYGSAMGNFTHFGYSFRKLFTSYFLMKDVLAEEGKLDEAARAMLWYSMANETFIAPTQPGMDIDTFNTLAIGRVCSVLAMADSPEKVGYLQSYSRWINNGCLPAKGLDDSFKSDGSVYHHKNHYPAYGVGGLTGATDVIYLLHNTAFAVSQLGHNAVKKSLLTMRFYCNQWTYPLAMSGRHPNGKGKLDPSQFARLALAGSPDRSQSIDTELASAYMRLVNADVNYGTSLESKPDHKRYIATFKSAGITAEQTPQGTIAMPYATSLVHRVADWSVVIRGHSRYLWAAEHYRGANLYGRYIAHGGLELNLGTPKSWVEEGFNWARIPGTTAIQLPIDSMKAKVLNVDTFSGYEEMLYSDEAFAGALAIAGKGNFAMKLHEHDKYNGSFRARKSFHVFGNHIVSIGTNIENTNTDYNTETILFQLPILTQNEESYWKKYQGSKNLWVDHLGSAYFIPKNEELIFENNENQESKYQNSGKENHGHWVNLVFNHGVAPKNASYEYMIVPEFNNTNLDFSKAIYKVLQKDSNAHIIEDLNSKTISYAVFETLSNFKEGIIQSVDTASLLMVSKHNETYELTVANPDIALYRGESDDIYNEAGKRIERSIYSRPWIGNASMEMPVTVQLKGYWELKGDTNDAIQVLKRNVNQTTLLFKCIEGKIITISIEEIKK